MSFLDIPLTHPNTRALVRPSARPAPELEPKPRVPNLLVLLALLRKSRSKYSADVLAREWAGRSGEGVGGVREREGGRGQRELDF